MRKIFLLLLLLAFSAGLLSAQDLVKYNYKKNGKIYTGTERIRVAPSSKDTPVTVKLSRVLFEDGQPVYILRMDFEETSAWKMPKNAPLTIVTTDGKTLVLKNSSDAPNLVAPKGIRNSSGNTVYLNYGEYYLEASDMKKLLSGIASIDATKRWSSDGYIKNEYKNNELGSAIAQQYEAINYARTPKSELGSNLQSLQDQGGSRLAETSQIRVNSKLSVALVYLYYAASNSESIDLNLYLDGQTIPFTSPITILTKSGDEISLKQEKDLSAGRAICYPTLDELKEMLGGVSKITISTTGSDAVFTFPSDEFAKALDKLYNSVETVAIL